MTGRRSIKCAICGKAHGKVYRYRKLLARFGYAGHYATMECVGNLPRPDMSDVEVLVIPTDPIPPARPRRRRARSASADDRTVAALAPVSIRSRAR